MRTLIGLTALAGLAGLASCTEPETILPGERFAIREVLEGRAPDTERPNVVRPAALPPARVNAAWAQSPVSPAARTDHAALQLPLAPLFETDIGQGDRRRQRLIADPVTDGSRIYTMSSDFQVSATAPNGAPLWSVTLVPARDGASQAQGGGLAVGAGRLLVATGFGELTALDTSTGAELWTQKLDATATGAPSIAGDVAYVTSGDQVGWAIELADGRVRWQADTAPDTNNVAGAPAPAFADGRVVFAFGNGALQTSFRQGGLPLWSGDVVGQRVGRALSTVGDITGDPTIADGRVYAGNHAGRLVAFDLFSGDRVWTVNEGALDMPWPAGDSIYYVSDLNELTRRDAATGEKVWAVPLPSWKPSARPSRRRDVAFANHGPILAGGQLVVASTDGAIRLFDPASGALTGRIEIPGGATTAPIVAGGTLYVVSTRGRLHAFR